MQIGAMPIRLVEHPNDLVDMFSQDNTRPDVFFCPLGEGVDRMDIQQTPIFDFRCHDRACD